MNKININEVTLHPETLVCDIYKQRLNDTLGSVLNDLC
jgi:hypothetical protein